MKFKYILVFVKLKYLRVGEQDIVSLDC
uniref:Uncharacterized protein MANES_02G095700 n=1 Tax=Rhizophora mucronata TaxID=61149 RepID=A0A2P2KRL7_RHIMU